jgi:hypothetical protein
MGIAVLGLAIVGKEPVEGHEGAGSLSGIARAMLGKKGKPCLDRYMPARLDGLIPRARRPICV